MGKSKRKLIDPYFWSNKRVLIWLKSHPLLASLCPRFRTYSGRMLRYLSAVDLSFLIPDDEQRDYFEMQLRLLFGCGLSLYKDSPPMTKLILLPVLDRPFIPGISVKFTEEHLFAMHSSVAKPAIKQ